MARHAIVDSKTNKVVNLVVWDGAEWLPPRDHYVVQNDYAYIGQLYDPTNNEFIPCDNISSEK